MKIWSSEHVFNHSWENVVKAVLQNKPNPMDPTVTGIDVIEREIDQERATMKSHRLIASKWSLSPWISSLIGGNKTCYSSEHSCISLKKKELWLRTRNLTFSHVVRVEEMLTYSMHPHDPSKTLLRHEARVTVYNVIFIEYLENFVTNKLISNTHIARQALEMFINQLSNYRQYKHPIDRIF